VITRFDQLRGQLARFGTSPIDLLCDLIISSTMLIFSGIGLWFQTRWRWNVATFVLALSLARNALSLSLGHLLIEQLQQSQAFYYTRHAIGAAIAVAALTYMFRLGVMQHCDVDPNRRHHLKNLCTAVAAGIGLELLFG
jgi:hypothetical protein